MEQLANRKAYFEKIVIPANQSFILKLDNYPAKRNVWNYHPEFELHLILKTSGICYIGDYIGPFEVGQLTLVGSGLPHNWITLPAADAVVEGRGFIVQFESDRYIEQLSPLVDLTGLRDLFDRAQFGIEFSPAAAHRALAVLEAMYKMKALAQLGKMIELLSILDGDEDARTLSTRNFVTRFRAGADHELKRLDDALTYLQNNFLTRPSINDISETVGMSQSAFSRFFKRQTGNTFTDYIISLRLWTAKKILAEGNIPITDVCYECGFTNISNFNRTFLKRSGMTPSEFRRQAKRFETS